MGQRYVYDRKTGGPVSEQYAEDINNRRGNSIGASRFGSGSIDDEELGTWNAARNINKFAGEMSAANPRYQDYYSGQKRVSDVDADLLAQQRGETYRAPGAGSPWLSFAKGNIGAQRDTALSRVAGAAQGQKQSAWNRMGASGLTAGAMDRTGAKADLAAAFGAQEVAGQANQQMLDASTQDELDRQQKLSGAPAMENAATAGSQYMLGQDLGDFASKEDFNQSRLDTAQQVEAAKKLGIATLPQDTLAALQQRGFKY